MHGPHRSAVGALSRRDGEAERVRFRGARPARPRHESGGGVSGVAGGGPRGDSAGRAGGSWECQRGPSSGRREGQCGGPERRVRGAQGAEGLVQRTEGFGVRPERRREPPEGFPKGGSGNTDRGPEQPPGLRRAGEGAGRERSDVGDRGVGVGGVAGASSASAAGRRAGRRPGVRVSVCPVRGRRPRPARLRASAGEAGSRGARPSPALHLPGRGTLGGSGAER